MTSSFAPRAEAVMLQEDRAAHARSDRDLATIEFVLGFTVGIALAFAVVLHAHRALCRRVLG